MSIWQTLERSHLLSSIEQSKQKLIAGRIGISGESGQVLNVECPDEAAADRLSFQITGDIAVLVKQKPELHTVREVRYFWGGGEFTFPLVLPRGVRSRGAKRN